MFFVGMYPTEVGKQTAQTKVMCLYQGLLLPAWFDSLQFLNGQILKCLHFIPMLQAKGNWRGKESCKKFILLKILLQSNVKISLSTFYSMFTTLLFKPEHYFAASYPNALHRLTFIITDSFLAFSVFTSVQFSFSLTSEPTD